MLPAGLLPMTQPTDQDWRRAIASLRRVVIRRGLSGADVDDAVQRTLEKAVRHLRRSSDVEQFGPWLHQIAANEAIDRQRANQRAPVSIDIDEAVSVAAAAPDIDPLVTYADCVTPFLSRLSPADGDALALKDLQGLTFNEVAQALGISVPGAKSRVQRARRRLAAELMECCKTLRSTPITEANRHDCSSACCGVPKVGGHY